MSDKIIIKEIEEIIDKRYKMNRKYNERNRSLEYFIKGLKSDIEDLKKKFSKEKENGNGK